MIVNAKSLGYQELNEKIRETSEHDIIIEDCIGQRYIGAGLSGKTIIPFVSHGGGRLGQSVTDIAKLCPSSKILEALSVRYSGGSSLSEDMDEWLNRIGMKG